MSPSRLRFLFPHGLVVITAVACSDSDGPTGNRATRLTITPAESTFSLDRRVPFTATVYDARDSVIAGASITWVSSAPAIASVSDSGLVTAIAEGRATIVATSGTARAEAAVRVTSTRLMASFQHKYCAIRSDDRVFCNNLEAFPPGPRIPVPMDVALVDLAVGENHACGLTAAGEAYCWGSNAFLQLGVPNVAADSALRVATTERFRKLSAGIFHTCGITTAGRAFCWGSNVWGNGTGGHAPTPRPVATEQTFTQIGTGFYRTCALTTGGEVYCWGDRPELLDAPGQRFRTISIVIHVQCGATTTNRILCGEGRWNETPTSNLPVPLVSVTPSGWGSNCGLTADGAAYCWGSNSRGELGNGQTSPQEQATPVVGGLRFRSLHLTNTYTCGLSLDGRTYCWGSQFTSATVDDAPNTSTQPVQVLLIP
jgi:hypothetical protein